MNLRHKTERDWQVRREWLLRHRAALAILVNPDTGDLIRAEYANHYCRFPDDRRTVRMERFEV